MQKINHRHFFPLIGSKKGCVPPSLLPIFHRGTTHPSTNKSSQLKFGQFWHFFGKNIFFGTFSWATLYLHYMRYRTDPITREKWFRSRKVSILDIFWHLNYANYAKLRFFWDLGSFAKASTHFIFAQYAISDRSYVSISWKWAKTLIVG